MTWEGDYGAPLMARITLAAASGVTAFAHGRSRSRPALAGFGALTAGTALGALSLGGQLHG